MEFEVAEPILNSPFHVPGHFWFIREGEMPEKRTGRRPSIVFPPRDQRREWSEVPGILSKSGLYSTGYELDTVNQLRQRVQEWQDADYPGATRVTYELLHYWKREGRERRLFFAQREAAETIIFLKEARADFRQGIQVPRETTSANQQEAGINGFERLACKMATGSGKTTVMGMLIAWSVLNKVADKNNSTYSDTVLVVCPNVTIRDRLNELLPEPWENSVYFTRDLVPEHFKPQLLQGKIIATNWHVFQPQTPNVGGESAKVIKTGKPVTKPEIIHISDKNTTARGKRYLTQETYRRLVASDMLEVRREITDTEGNLVQAEVLSTRYVESDTALVNRIIGRQAGGKQNILVINDEAHHAYRIFADAGEEEEDEFGDQEMAEDFFKEATVWVDGLDKVNKLRGINFCVDLSATPFYLGRVGQEVNKPFPWVVSDFGLIEAIEAGLVKIPQLASRDLSGEEKANYFNVWNWILEKKLTTGERGGKKAEPKPEAVLKYASVPISMLAGQWEADFRQAQETGSRTPVFIVVCKNTRIAKVVYEWIAEGKQADQILPFKVNSLRNLDGAVNTIRVDSKVVEDMDGNKNDESRWMRYVLETVGKKEWGKDPQGNPVYSKDFPEIAEKMGRPLTPPGRDVRCIVSVGMLTEGWDCNTVSYVIGLRPFMSQLLCEQVVGRGLRRMSYELDEGTGMFTEETATVLGVPFEVIPFKANPQGQPTKQAERKHIHAIPQKVHLEIRFPRVEGYTTRINNRIRVDWDKVTPLVIDPTKTPTETELANLHITDRGKTAFQAPGKTGFVSLQAYRNNIRIQEVVFDMAAQLTKSLIENGSVNLPTHILFPQILRTVQKFMDDKVQAQAPADKKDVAFAEWYVLMMERLRAAIQPDTSAGEEPELPILESSRPIGSTSDVNYWTSKPAPEVRKSHLNRVVSDTKTWEQSTAYYLDTSEHVRSFAKNAGLGFVIPYYFNGQQHEYIPDFLVRLETEDERFLIVETKGFEREEDRSKKMAAERWCAAVNAHGGFGKWDLVVVRRPEEVINQFNAFKKYCI